MGIAPFTIYRRACPPIADVAEKCPPALSPNRCASSPPRQPARAAARPPHSEHRPAYLPGAAPRARPGAPLVRPTRKNGTILDTPADVINMAVKRRVRAAGINPARYGAHSLRAGFVTEAFRAGATHHEVMRQTGHRGVATAEGYPREPDPLRHNAVTRIGLWG